MGVRQSTERLHASLSWLRVEERLACNLLSFFRNICYSKQPNCLYSQIIYVRNQHSHNTRQAIRGYIANKKPQTDALRISVMYRAIAMWNILPGIITNVPSKASFKKLLRDYFNKNPMENGKSN